MFPSVISRKDHFPVRQSLELLDEVRSRIAHSALETLRRQRRRREKECIRDSRQSDLDLGAYTFTVRGTLAGTPPINSVPDSPIGLVGALTLLATLAVGH